MTLQNHPPCRAKRPEMVFHFPSSLEEGPPRRRMKHQVLTCEDAHMPENNFNNEKRMRYGQSTPLHLRSDQRFILIIKLNDDIACPAQAAR